MKTILLVSALLIGSSCLFGQNENDTIYSIKINKEKTSVFRGADIETEQWFLYIDNYGIAYLANLNIEVSEIENWFIRRSDSDNIFKSTDIIENDMLIFMSKKNEPETVLPFYVIITEDYIELMNTENELNFKFTPINIQ